ncbi:MAG: hypothetical protein V3S30_06000 [Thermoanaerobaculia bacterium]
MQSRYLNILAMLFFGVVGMASAEVVIVGNKNIGVNQLSMYQARAIWLGQEVKLGRTTLVAADLPASDELRKDFLSDVLELTLKGYRLRRMRLAFKEQLLPPTVLKSQALVRQWVAEDPYRVGYLRPAMVDSTVKVLLRVKD